MNLQQIVIKFYLNYMLPTAKQLTTSKQDF